MREARMALCWSVGGRKRLTGASEGTMEGKEEGDGTERSGKRMVRVLPERVRCRRRTRGERASDGPDGGASVKGASGKRAVGRPVWQEAWQRGGPRIGNVDLEQRVAKARVTNDVQNAASECGV